MTAAERGQVAFLFDLDGTLVDSVYQHVLAWREALRAVGISSRSGRIHRRIGMSGGLFANALLRETGIALDPEVIASASARLHAEAYPGASTSVRPLPGARELSRMLTRAGVPWAIATSGRLERPRPTLELLGMPMAMPVVTRDQVAHAKPDPDLFLAAAERIGVDDRATAWSSATACGTCSPRGARAPRRRSALRRLRPGGAERAGAYRVYEDPADLLVHLDEVGVRRPL